MTDEEIIDCLNRGRVSFVVEKLLPLAKGIAKRFCGDAEINRRRDIFSEAFLGLCKAVAKIKKRLDSNNQEYEVVLPYIKAKIAGQIRYFLRNDHIIRIPLDAFVSLAREYGNVDFLPIVYAYAEVGSDVLRHDGGGHFEASHGKGYVTDGPDDPNFQSFDDHIAEINDFLNQLHLSEIEVKVLYFKLQDYSFFDIAEKIGVSKPRVGQILDKIKDRCYKHLASRDVETETVPPVSLSALLFAKGD